VNIDFNLKDLIEFIVKQKLSVLVPLAVAFGVGCVLAKGSSGTLPSMESSPLYVGLAVLFVLTVCLIVVNLLARLLGWTGDKIKAKAEFDYPIDTLDPAEFIVLAHCVEKNQQAFFARQDLGIIEHLLEQGFIKPYVERMEKPQPMTRMIHSTGPSNVKRFKVIDPLWDELVLRKSDIAARKQVELKKMPPVQRATLTDLLNNLDDRLLGKE
jgi:hypothetical protein